MANDILDQDLKNLPERARSWKNAQKKQIRKLKANKNLSILTREKHAEVFAGIDCLGCANCCKTTGPLFTTRDIERIAKHLQLSYQDFVSQYLREDEDGDLVLQKVPCPFLQSDNHCLIYEVRPKACREYPHTDAHHQNKIFSLTLKNAEICPAVLEILQRLLAEFDQKQGKGNR